VNKLVKFNRNGYCDFCEDERWAIITVYIGDHENASICYYCLNDKWNEEYRKEV
jgi:hypothetical protein